MKKRLSFKIALCGIITAIGIFLMFFTGIMPLMTYALPALAGALTIILVIEFGVKWAFMTYFSIGLLSLFLAADKESAVLFVLFLGYYPIIKSFYEKIKLRALEWFLKIASFNLSIIVAYIIIINVFGMNEILNEMNDFGRYTIYVLLGMGNFAFIVYDIALSRAISAYINSLRVKFINKLK